MGRWEPNARGRLEQAALKLYRERGFDQTTVAEIAARAGLTERTFFRYFADKREVLFWGQSALVELFVRAVAEAPDSAAPIDAVGAALGAVCGLFEGRREQARDRRQRRPPRTRADQAGDIGIDDDRGTAPSRRSRTSSESGRTGRYRRLQGLIRALDRRRRRSGPVPTDAGVAR